MTWTYVQDTGLLYDPSRTIATRGYSGLGIGKNNPNLQNIHGVGPIPCGEWEIGDPFNSEVEGSVVMRLTPKNGTYTYGRDGFLVHGDSIADPGCASHGCIILPRPERLVLATTKDRALRVISTEREAA